MDISIFGLGYVGCVSLGCLAQNGHTVIGVDINSTKVNLINNGKPTIVEAEIDIIIAQQHKESKIKATSDYNKAIAESDVSIICVGTPSTLEGHLNLDYIFDTAKQIGSSLENKKEFHVVVIRSTVLPGTNIKVGEIIEKCSGKKRNLDFAIVSNPEFLREGTSVEDFFNPPLTVLGSDNQKAIHLLTNMYKGINGPIEIVDIEVAEIIKYVNNSYHALKITFANEVGNICKKLKIDSHEVMRIFGMDKQLNISTYYFKPGFAYGGSCLPKDLKALKTLAHDMYIESPVINSIETSNNLQKEKVIELVEITGRKKVGILGLSFKSGTDDLRYSPIVDVIEKLHGKGYDIKIYDKNVILSRLIGKNKSFIEEKLPHISKMLKEDINYVINSADIIIITNKDKSFEKLNFPEHVNIIDLARLMEYSNINNYVGICW